MSMGQIIHAQAAIQFHWTRVITMTNYVGIFSLYSVYLAFLAEEQINQAPDGKQA